MSVLPTAIILVNNDLSDSVRDMLVRQLFIDEVIDGYQLDDRIAANPGYVQSVKNHFLRILVKRPFTEMNNREVFDVVGFVSGGMIAIEQNKIPGYGGAPNLTYPIVNLYWGQLNIF